MKEHQFTYKDGNRVNWTLYVIAMGETITRPEIDAIDHIWHYRLIKDDTNTIIMRGEVVGQYDMMPNITEFLADIQSQTTSLLLGMAKYAK